MTPAALADAWRARADDLARYGATQAAETCRVLAGELEAALAEHAAETLTLAEASAESGYSERRLRELVASGEVPQAGRRGAPRIRRADLPVRKRTATNGYDPASDAASIVGRMHTGRH